MELNPCTAAAILTRILNQSQSSGLPDFEGPWQDVSTAGPWRIYVVHDPCHDDGEHLEDRNTVIALHETEGLWRILGRELTKKHALQIAQGEV